MSAHEQQITTWIASLFATITGSTLIITMNDIDILSRLLLTWLTIFSVALLIGVNWKKGISGLKELFNKIKK